MWHVADGKMVTYSGERWREARKATLARDDGRCQSCGTTDSLHAHHIKPVREFENESDAHYVENLVMLCKACHRKWEGKSERPKLARAEDGTTVNEVAHSLAADTASRAAFAAALPEMYYLWIEFSPAVCSTCLRRIGDSMPNSPNFQSFDSVVRYVADGHASPISSRSLRHELTVNNCEACESGERENTNAHTKAQLVAVYLGYFGFEFDRNDFAAEIPAGNRVRFVEKLVAAARTTHDISPFDSGVTSRDAYRGLCGVDEGLPEGRGERDELQYLEWYKDNIGAE